jgi:CubicO group peptidase (beta-lactamase class C family)
MTAMAATALDGWADPRFAPVEQVFRDVVAGQSGTGAAVAVWHDGAWVVDLWGGYADAAHTRAWRSDSLVMPYSVTKPFVAVCALVLADRGLVDLDERVAAYWPELRAPATLRQLLAHQSGIVALDQPVAEEAFYDWDLICRLLAAQEPSWRPGDAHGESALFYGHLVGEVVRRVDGRSLGAFLREEVCGPHGLDFHIGLRPDDLPRVVDLTGFDAAFRRRAREAPGLMSRALANPPGALEPSVVNSNAWRTAEIPAVNGHGTARAVAGFYVALQRRELLSADLLAQMQAVTASGPDRVLADDRQWGLGVAVEPDGYGMGGVGGSVGWWSCEGEYALAFLTGQIADHDRGDRIESAVRGCLGLPPL